MFYFRGHKPAKTYPVKVLSILTTLRLENKGIAFPVDTEAMGFLSKTPLTCLSSRFFSVELIALSLKVYNMKQFF